MSGTSSIIQKFRNPGAAVFSLAGKGYLNWMGDELFLKIVFKHMMGYPLDLKNPSTFNEKLQWLKLHDRKTVYQTYVDKYQVKEYIAEQIGEEYVIPTIGVWDRADDIDFGKLPDQFVLKCVHGSGCNVICKDKGSLDITDTKQKLDRWMHQSWYWPGREWPYRDVRPRIIAEPYLEDSSGQLTDYKFFCFGGEVRCFKIDFDRATGHRANYYTPDGELMRFGETICPPDYDRKIDMPTSLEKMIEFAKKLSEGIPFVRVDFYEVNGHILFGELTLFPASGFGRFTDTVWDYRLGEWLVLPEGEK